MSTDEWLVCLIYVLTRANVPDIPAYLGFVNSFILARKKEQCEMLLCNLQAALELTTQLDDLTRSPKGAEDAESYVSLPSHRSSSRRK